jgi:hypothetical protein
MTRKGKSMEVMPENIIPKPKILEKGGKNGSNACNWSQ